MKNVPEIVARLLDIGARIDDTGCVESISDHSKESTMKVVQFDIANAHKYPEFRQGELEVGFVHVSKELTLAEAEEAYRMGQMEKEFDCE